MMADTDEEARRRSANGPGSSRTRSATTTARSPAAGTSQRQNVYRDYLDRQQALTEAVEPTDEVSGRCSGPSRGTAIGTEDTVRANIKAYEDNHLDVLILVAHGHQAKIGVDRALRRRPARRVQGAPRGRHRPWLRALAGPRRHVSSRVCMAARARQDRRRRGSKPPARNDQLRAGKRGEAAAYRSSCGPSHAGISTQGCPDRGSTADRAAMDEARHVGIGIA